MTSRVRLSLLQDRQTGLHLFTADDLASRQLLCDGNLSNDGGSIIGNTPRRNALSVSTIINNVTDEFVIIETEKCAARNGSIVRGRPLSGTSSVLGFSYVFELSDD